MGGSQAASHEAAPHLQLMATLRLTAAVLLLSLHTLITMHTHFIYTFIPALAWVKKN